MEKKRELFNFDRAILLLLIIALFVLVKTFFAPYKAADLTQEAEIVLNKLTDGNTEVSLLRSNQVIEAKIENLDKMGYEQIKNILGIRSDFCIYFEDISGNIVKINDLDLGIGSNKIYVNGQPCR